jgi:hypothetical protein
MLNPISEPVPVPTKRVLKPWLEMLKVGDTYRFPIATNIGSLRVAATKLAIKIACKLQDDGSVKVTRTA